MGTLLLRLYIQHSWYTGIYSYDVFPTIEQLKIVQNTYNTKWNQLGNHILLN